MVKPKLISVPRPRTNYYDVDCWTGNFHFFLKFEDHKDALDCIEALSRCASIDGMSLFYKGKFLGGRDGGT